MRLILETWRYASCSMLTDLVCFVLLWLYYMWFVYPYSSGLLHWHWGSDCPGASEVTLMDMGKISCHFTITKHSKMCTMIIILGTDCFFGYEQILHSRSRAVSQYYVCCGVWWLKHIGNYIEWQRFSKKLFQMHSMLFSLFKFRVECYWNVLLWVLLIKSQFWCM